MSFMWLLLLNVIALGVHGAKLNTRIVGGNNASITNYGFLVSLRYYNAHFCAGSIIDDYYILTAAHCLYKLPKNDMGFTIVAGATDLTGAGIVYKASGWKIHEKYDNKSNNDIGLIRTSKKISLGKTIKKIEISSSDIGSGETVDLAGWGYVAQNGPKSNILQNVTLTTITNSRCTLYFQRYITSNTLCTQASKGKGACRGDSGGPLILKNKQIGIVSFGSDCAVGVPDAYTRVSNYITWIKRNKNL